MPTIENQSNHIPTRIYYCGGFGFNIGSKVGATFPGACFLDSSDANLKDKSIPADRIYLIPGTDGAGGDQAFMMPHARAHADEMIAKFEPAEFNVVVIGAGGGSGATIGIQLVRKLLAAGYPTAVLVVTGTDTTRRLRNTLNVIKNLEATALAAKLPVIAAFTDNTSERSTDEEVVFQIDALVALTDQQNARLDTRDIENWVQYNKVCAVEPQLSRLYISTTRQDAAAVLEPISTASLYVDPDKYVPFGNAFVGTVGFPTNDAKMDFDQLHFVINSIGIQNLMDQLEEDRVKLTTVQSSYRQRRAIITADDKLTDDGFSVD